MINKIKVFFCTVTGEQVFWCLLVFGGILLSLWVLYKFIRWAVGDDFINVMKWLCPLFSGLLGGVLSYGLIHVTSRELFPQEVIIPTQASDVISTANTYIVFVTFIFLFITVLLTGVGIVFTRWVGITREREISDLVKDFQQTLQGKHKLAKKFVEEILKNETVSSAMAAEVAERIKAESPREEESLEKEWGSQPVSAVKKQGGVADD